MNWSDFHSTLQKQLFQVSFSLFHTFLNSTVYLLPYTILYWVILYYALLMTRCTFSMHFNTKSWKRRFWPFQPIRSSFCHCSCTVWVSEEKLHELIRLSQYTTETTISGVFFSVSYFSEFNCISCSLYNVILYYALLTTRTTFSIHFNTKSWKRHFWAFQPKLGCFSHCSCTVWVL